MVGELGPKEREVIRAMRASERAHEAIHQYAVKFEGDDQSFTVREWSDDYGEEYGSNS